MNVYILKRFKRIKAEEHYEQFILLSQCFQKWSAVDGADSVYIEKNIVLFFCHNVYKKLTAAYAAKGVWKREKVNSILYSK